MATQYTVTTVAAIAASAGALLTIVENALTAHGGWTYMEEVAFTQGAVARRCRTWRCNSGTNAYGVNFYVQLCIDNVDNTGRFAVRASEGWDGANHVPLNATVAGNATVTPAADFTAAPSGGTWLLANTQTPAAVDTFWLMSMISITDVVVLVTNSTLWISTEKQGAAVIQGAMAGYMTPLYTDSTTTYPPLCVVCLTTPSTSAATQGTSRAIRATGAVAFAAIAATEVLPWGQISIASGVIGDGTITTCRGSRVLVIATPMSVAGIATKGYLTDTLAFNIVAANLPRIGDTLVVGGVTYAYISATAAMCAAIAGTAAQGMFVIPASTF
jgi:hypothetical protein